MRGAARWTLGVSRRAMTAVGHNRRPPRRTPTSRTRRKLPIQRARLQSGAALSARSSIYSPIESSNRYSCNSSQLPFRSAWFSDSATTRRHRAGIRRPYGTTAASGAWRSISGVHHQGPQLTGAVALSLTWGVADIRSAHTLRTAHPRGVCRLKGMQWLASTSP
jgi:hypothetical protein